MVLAGHPWLVEVESCGMPYSRFTPQKLTVTRLSCMTKLPSRIDLNFDGTSGDRSADTRGSEYGSHFFAPVLRFQLANPQSGVVDEEIISTEPAVIGGEDQEEFSCRN